ncbi:hypothetical protein CsSME_00030605 [Camellia sinensis var. sinensis]
MKINYDTSFSKLEDKVALAVVLRDGQRKLVDGMVSTIYTSSSKLGEALAIRLACLFLQALGFLNVQVESNNKEVIDLCVSEQVPPWECSAIIHDIQSLNSTLNASFAWIPMEANGVAHWLARTHLQGTLPFDWVAYPPIALSELLVAIASM